jgi:hypothetical protein
MNGVLCALSGVFFSLCAIRIFGDETPRPALLGLLFGLLLCGLLTSKRKDRP